MNMEKVRRKTKDAKIFQQSIRNVKKGLKHAIGSSVRILAKKHCTPTFNIPTLTKHAMKVVWSYD